MFLENPQQLGLSCRRHVSDLVQKQASTTRLLEAPDTLPIRAGKRAALVTEQFRLEQGFGKRRAVHLHQGPLGTRRKSVNETGDHLLAGSGLTRDENGRTRGRYPRREFDGRSQGRTLRNEILAPIAGDALRSQFLDFVEQLPMLDRTGDTEFDLLEIERLLDEVERTGAHRANRGLDGPVSRHQQDAGPRVPLECGTKHRNPIATRQPKIGQDHVVGVRRRGDSAYGFVSRCGVVNGAPGLSERALDTPAQRFVVFDDQDPRLARRRHSSTSLTPGSRT